MASLLMALLRSVACASVSVSGPGTALPSGSSYCPASQGGPWWEPGNGAFFIRSPVFLLLPGSAPDWEELKREAAIKGRAEGGSPQEVLEGLFDGNPLSTVYFSWSVTSPLGLKPHRLCSPRASWHRLVLP